MDILLDILLKPPQPLMWLFFTYSKHVLHFLQLQVQITEQRPVAISVSLCTQTGLHYLTSEILDTRV